MGTRKDRNRDAAFAEGGVDIQSRTPIERVQGRLGAYFAPHHRVIFLCSFVSILLTHLYIFTNVFVNHDNIGHIFAVGSFGLYSGRWLLKWATDLAGDFSSPWLDGIVGAVLFAAACTIFAAIFDVRRPLPACLLVLCMVAFPTVASIYTYMFTASQYFLSMLLAVLSVWLLHRGGVVGNLTGVLCIACSMGIYQAFFCLTAATLVLTMLMEVCEGHWKDSFKGFFIAGLRYVGWLGLGLALYLVITKVCLWYTGTELVDYQGLSSMGQITFPVLLQRIKEAYCQLGIYYFQNPNMYPMLFRVLVAVSFVVDIVVVGLLLLARGLNKNIVNSLQLVILIAILPLACNSVYLMANIGTVHHLMIYPAVLPLLLPVLLGSQMTAQDMDLLGERGKGKLQFLAMLCTCGVLLTQAIFGYHFVVLTNRAYTCMDLTYKSAYAYYTRLTAKIELQEGYTPDTHIAILGKAAQPFNVPYPNMTGIVSLNVAINMYSRPQFLTYFIGSAYQYASPEEIEQVKASPEFQQMPCYPAEGSIETIGGVIAVKLGE